MVPLRLDLARARFRAARRQSRQLLSKWGFPARKHKLSNRQIAGRAGEKVHFSGDEREDCPQDKNCRLKSYLIPGDEVIVSRNFGAYACAWFSPKKGHETVGWIPLENLEFTVDQKILGPDNWIGKWAFYDNSIDIAKAAQPGVYLIKGSALWKGLGDNVHVGELDGEAKFIEGSLKYGAEDDESDCRVSMQLAGNYLIVTDNLNCGGANVTFAGVYQRKSKK